jgi:hypothetical protein
MKDFKKKYESPQIIMIDLHIEQAFLVGSGGHNESLHEDPDDYSEYFE